MCACDKLAAARPSVQISRMPSHTSSRAPRRPVSPAEPRVALLRGVNVGGGKRVPMAELRAIATRLGFGDAVTLLNSGNLVYRSNGTPGHDATMLRQALRDTLGVDTPVMVRSRDALMRVLEANPLRAQAETDPSRLLVTVWEPTLPRELLEAFACTVTTRERFVLGADALYLWFPDGISASPVYEKASRPLGVHVTARNWRTMTQLQTMLDRPWSTPG